MHNIRNVTENLYWVGASDSRLSLFENIHPLTNGVSYNSYLLLDEKTVLLDTVDWAVSRQFIENIDHVLDGKSLDYIILNHVEPDHGASLEEVLIRHPQVKLVATAKAFTMVNQFGFNVDNHELITVKDGDSLSFGRHTMSFYTAPMVHWPEAMVTFDETNGALFSADAFGTFGALDGKLFNDEVNFDRDWIDEARRYYTNIVGKYGVNVQKLFAKLAPVIPEIKFICPLHGPIWRNNFEYFIEKHDKWSKYEPEENGVLIVYASMYGNTEAVAQVLANKLCQKGLTNFALYDVSKNHVSNLISESFKYSHIVLASVTYNLEIYPPMHNFLNDMRALNLQNRTFAVIENGTWAIKAGDLIEKFITESMKNMSLLGDRFTITSSCPNSREEEIDLLVDTLIESVNK